LTSVGLGISSTTGVNSNNGIVNNGTAITLDSKIGGYNNKKKYDNSNVPTTNSNLFKN